MEWVRHATVNRILNQLSQLEEFSHQRGAAFLSMFEGDPAAQALIADALALQIQLPDATESQIIERLTHLRNDFITTELQRQTRELVNPELTEEQRLAISERQKELREQRKQPLG
jgi:hypothetical protein